MATSPSVFQFAHIGMTIGVAGTEIGKVRPQPVQFLIQGRQSTRRRTANVGSILSPVLT